MGVAYPPAPREVAELFDGWQDELATARKYAPLVRNYTACRLVSLIALAAANVAQFLLGAAWIPMWFFLNLYLQQVLGYTAFPSGAALLPMTVLIMIGMITRHPRRSPGSAPRRWSSPASVSWPPA
jgi:hypothetical protein